MARPRKTGVDYFPLDIDFFEDEKIVAIAREFGIKGEITVIKLLCAIYRNGYFIEWSEAMQLKMLQQLPGVSAELLNTILSRLVKWGFFDEHLFDSVKVLTSGGIQRRYLGMTRKREDADISPELLVSGGKNPVSGGRNPVSGARNTQSKVNKSKERTTIVVPKKERLSLCNPKVEEVLEYFADHSQARQLKDSQTAAQKFFNHFEAVGWLDAQGRSIANWKASANMWIMKEFEFEKKSYNENRKADRFEQRRGVEPSSTSRKDFKGTL